MKSDWETVFAWTWKAGLTLAAIGQAGAAFHSGRGGTASEHFARASRPLQFLIVGAAFATLAHWVWPPPVVIVENVEHVENLTVNEEGSNDD